MTLEETRSVNNFFCLSNPTSTMFRSDAHRYQNILSYYDFVFRSNPTSTMLAVHLLSAVEMTS